jgi:uncharacterized protein (TIGR02145 family)
MFINSEMVIQYLRQNQINKGMRQGKIKSWLCVLWAMKKNGKKYGRLFNWHAVNDPRVLAPEGRHVPTDDEWGAINRIFRRRI